MNHIKKYRELKRLSIHELARRTELTPSYISNLEKGKRDNPSKETMDKIAKELDQTVPKIFYPEEVWKIKTIVKVDNNYNVVKRKVINEKEMSRKTLDLIIPIFKKELREE